MRQRKDKAARRKANTHHAISSASGPSVLKSASKHTLRSSSIGPHVEPLSLPMNQITEMTPETSLSFSVFLLSQEEETREEQVLL